MGKGDEWILVPVTTLAPIATLLPDQLQKFTKDELRSYLIHYGVTPDARKPEMKGQVRRLISAAQAGMLTTLNGHLICGQKERAKSVSALIPETLLPNTNMLAPLTSKRKNVQKQKPLNCRNCGETINEKCQYVRCPSCCAVAGLRCKVHSPSSLKRKREVPVSLSDLDTLIAKKRKNPLGSGWTGSEQYEGTSLRLERDIAVENAKNSYLERDLLMRQIFSHQSVESIIGRISEHTDNDSPKTEERIKLLQQRQRELEQEIETETKRGEKDRQEAERRAGGYDDILNAIDDIEGDKNKLDECYNKFESSTGISRQFFPNLVAEAKTPPGFYIPNGTFRLFREDEYPSIATL